MKNTLKKFICPTCGVEPEHTQYSRYCQSCKEYCIQRELPRQYQSGEYSVVRSYDGTRVWVRDDMTGQEHLVFMSDLMDHFIKTGQSLGHLSLAETKKNKTMGYRPV